MSKSVRLENGEALRCDTADDELKRKKRVVRKKKTKGAVLFGSLPMELMEVLVMLLGRRNIASLGTTSKALRSYTQELSVWNLSGETAELEYLFNGLGLSKRQRFLQASSLLRPIRYWSTPEVYIHNEKGYYYAKNGETARIYTDVNEFLGSFGRHALLAEEGRVTATSDDLTWGQSKETLVSDLGLEGRYFDAKNGVLLVCKPDGSFHCTDDTPLIYRAVSGLTVDQAKRILKSFAKCPKRPDDEYNDGTCLVRQGRCLSFVRGDGCYGDSAVCAVREIPRITTLEALKKQGKACLSKYGDVLRRTLQFVQARGLTQYQKWFDLVRSDEETNTIFKDLDII